MEIFEYHPECRNCGLYSELNNNTGIGGRGSTDPQIIFIGEGPGREEDKQGLCFVGPSGNSLLPALAALDREGIRWRLTNCSRCYPGETKVAVKHVRACRPFLINELDGCKPKIIVTLGLWAIKSLMNDFSFKLGNIRGNIYKFGDIPVIPTYHPAKALREGPEEGKETLKSIFRDIGFALEIIKSGKVYPEVKWVMVETIEQLNKLKELLLNSEQVALDFEYSVDLHKKAGRISNRLKTNQSVVGKNINKLSHLSRSGSI